MTETSAAELRRDLLLDAPDELLEEELEQRQAEEEAQDEALPLWQPTIRERVREAWESRYLLKPMMFRAIPAFRGRILGRAWIVLRPFMSVFGFSLVLGGIFHAKAPNGVPYILFLIFSMQAFRVFDLTTYYETMSTKFFKSLIRGLRVPLLLVPVATIARVVVMLVMFWVFAAIALVYYAFTKGHFYLELSPKLLAGLGGLALCILYGVAIGLTTSVIYPRARDMKYFVRYGMQLLMFVTPVLYSVHQLPHTYQVIAQVNPIAPIVGLVQYGFLDAGGVSPWAVAWSIGSLLLVGAFGLWFFNRNATKWVGVYTLRGADDDDEEEEPI